VADDDTELESDLDQTAIGGARGDEPAEVEEAEEAALFEAIGTETEELDPFS